MVPLPLDWWQALEQFLWMLLIVCIVPAMYWLWFVPLDRVRSLHEVGFRHVSGRNRRQIINRMLQSRDRGNASLPPAFPNGWFVVAESRQLTRGSLLYVSAVGREVCVFRGTESGRVFVTSAYCPHLGADLASGGVVVGDSVRCPFHEWAFDGATGACTQVPYADKVPEFASLKTFTSMECNGLVYMWFDAEGRDPAWTPPVLHQLDASSRGGWRYQGRNEYEVSCHIQDIPENGADVAHLGAIHRTSIAGGGEPSSAMATLLDALTWHEWDVAWTPETAPDRKHAAVVQLTHSMKVAGRVQLFSLKVRGEQIGPSLVHLHFESCMGKGVMMQYVLPVEPLLQKIVHVFYTERTWLAPHAKFVLWGESVLLERDIRVWNSKTYLSKPLLVRQDSLIRQHRRWFGQFYSENSPRIGQTRKGVLDW